MKRIENLSGAAIFGGISDDEIEALCSRGRELSLTAGEDIFERGQEAREVLILRDGMVELHFPVNIMGVTRELTMETKQPGTVLAWSALVEPYRLTLAASCASACLLTGLSRDTLEAFFEQRPHVGYRFMRNLAVVIGRRLNAMQTIWLRDLQASAIKRLE